MRNVTGRENLNTCERMNGLAHASLIDTCSVVKALRPTEWDLDGTMLHYLAVWKSMVSIQRPVHLKLHTLPDKLIAVYPGKWL